MHNLSVILPEMGDATMELLHKNIETDTNAHIFEEDIKLFGGVNFIVDDIDNAKTMVTKT